MSTVNEEVKDRESTANSDCKSKPSNKGNRTNNARKKGKSNNRKKSFDRGSGLSSKGRDNDPSWYFSNAELAGQAAELSFQNMAGIGNIIDNAKAATILTLSMNPCPGVSYYPNHYTPSTDYTTLPAGIEYDSKDGINVMTTKLYTLLSSYSGRTTSYAPQDLATMVLYIGEIVSIIEHVRRMFGVALTYNPRNRMLPLKLLEAMGVDDPISMIANIADSRMNFNVEISRINQIPILDNIGYLRKCRDMYQKVYLDSPSSMAQMILMKPYSTWTFDEETYEQGTRLVTNILGKKTISGWISLIHSMITTVLESTSLNIIYSDLINLAAKISVPMWKMDFLSEGYVVIPEFNANFLLQLHNLDVLQKPSKINTSASATTDIYTDPTSHVKFTTENDVFPVVDSNSILYNPVFGHVPYLHIGHTIVDMPTDNPTLEDRIEALRYGVVRSGWMITPYSGKNYDVFYTLPDHYCVNMEIWTTTNATPLNVALSDLLSTTFTGEYCVLTQIQYGPIFYYHNQTSPWVDHIYGDLNFYTTVDYRYLNRLNRLMCVGLFDYRV